MAFYVARRRGTPAGVSLAVLLVAVAWWGLAYAFELTNSHPAIMTFWGEAKYAGVATLPPAWLCFVLQYIGRAHVVTRRLVLLLAVEPLAVLGILAVDRTDQLIRFYEATAPGEPPVVGTGPLFWVHLVYGYVLVVGATALFVTTMVRVSRLYWSLSAVLVVAALLPWTVNALHNLEVGPFARIDLTPFAFVVTGGVLVWGLFRERLVRLTPVARGVVVETMADAVLVLDPFRRVVDANPAAAHVLGRPVAEMVGRQLADLLPRHTTVAPRDPHVRATGAREQLTLAVEGMRRHFDARRQPLADRKGATAGELVVLRDVTERQMAEDNLRELLAERTRVASALQSSLLPAVLQRIPGCSLAALYRPAGDGREIGGDFYDTFRVATGEWGVVLGDVSGKGAEAAAVTALVRYTLRTLAVSGDPPSAVLAALSDMLLRQGADERYCTAAYALARRTASGVRLTLALGGHHPPLVVRNDGSPEWVGRLGTALGLVADPEIADTTVDLLPGELLCLFTDGLVEARRNGEQFDERRVADALRDHLGRPLQDVVDGLFEAALCFTGASMTDDVAILALRARPD
jgi:PAS domain S-box-containing protein